MKISIGIVDDHQLVLKSLSMLLDSFNHFKVTLEALNGKDLQAKIKLAKKLPEIMLVDVHMDLMNGIETATWLDHHYPEMKLVALSSSDVEKDVLGMIKAGCCAYLLKGTHPTELEKALLEIAAKGYYHADFSKTNFRKLLLYVEKENINNVILTNIEKECLKYACSDLTYNQIAGEMKTSQKAIDSCMQSLYSKLKVRSRIGLIVEAIKKGLIDPNQL